jgi:hypothetical protein
MLGVWYHRLVVGRATRGCYTFRKHFEEQRMGYASEFVGGRSNANKSRQATLYSRKVVNYED